MGHLFSVFLLTLLSFNLFSAQNIHAENIASNVSPVDMVMVFKEDRVLLLLHRGSIYRQYNISLGAAPVGQKHAEGDGRTPEGIYKIITKSARSGYYKALQISYPNRAQIAHGKKTGINPGSNIMIHGMKNGYGSVGPLHLFWDWTTGCIAVTDEEIDEVYSLVKIGTPVHIYP